MVTVGRDVGERRLIIYTEGTDIMWLHQIVSSSIVFSSSSFSSSSSSTSVSVFIPSSFPSSSLVLLFIISPPLRLHLLIPLLPTLLLLPPFPIALLLQPISFLFSFLSFSSCCSSSPSSVSYSELSNTYLILLPPPPLSIVLPSVSVVFNQSPLFRILFLLPSFYFCLSSTTSS